ncbi:MAG: Asp-tRNA(Asn)/Glu-tRNA(Gln) amidotransferase subunit GatC [Candidatus Marsarchaeota archaeon]|jgi:glutamyl-tRNA(Gln) and/or aspartyl-tRNA(Asn) amidotransferase, C subunit|nr:Asp-tRNA(Asn)/Glu-tRNA(Gln) amidotransferase subunit GatC [Candidatus Marsarchaeota archaeon]
MEDYWKINEELVRHISKAAKLNLSDDEVARYVREVGDILDAFRQIDKVDVGGEEPAFHPLPVENRWREDEEKKTEWDPFSNSESREDGYFKGPKII